jgi:hypothetical protein
MFLCFTGKLLLTCVEGITIQSRSGVEAVISLCPQLHTISFVSNLSTPSEDLLATEQLKSILATRWPKVKV